MTITSTIDSLCWRAHWQSLKYRLGDYCFWQFRFKAKVVDAPITCYFSDGKLLQGLIATVGEAKTSYVIESFPAPKHLPKLAINGKHLRYVPVQYLRYYIEFRGSFEQYLKKFSPKSRYNLARSVRMLGELDGGRVDCREYRLPKQMADFHQLADRLSKRTYQERVLREGLLTASDHTRICKSLPNSMRFADMFFSTPGKRSHMCFVDVIRIRYYMT